MPSPSTRREFLATASTAAAAAALTNSSAGAAQRSGSTRLVIGCHTRPFTTFRATQTNNPDYILDAIKGAGYEFADMVAAPGPGAGTGRNPAPAGAAAGAPAPPPQGRGVPATA